MATMVSTWGDVLRCTFYGPWDNGTKLNMGWTLLIIFPTIGEAVGANLPLLFLDFVLWCAMSVKSLTGPKQRLLTLLLVRGRILISEALLKIPGHTLGITHFHPSWFWLTNDCGVSTNTETPGKTCPEIGRTDAGTISLLNLLIAADLEWDE